MGGTTTGHGDNNATIPHSNTTGNVNPECDNNAPQHAPRPGGPQEHRGWINGRDPKGHHGTYGIGPLGAV